MDIMGGYFTPAQGITGSVRPEGLRMSSAHLSGSFLAATAAWIILTKQVLQTAWCAQGNVCMVARFVAQTTH